MKKMIYVFGIVMLMALSLASAQEQIPLRGRAQEKVEQWKKIRLMELLKLDEETSIRFFTRYSKHMENMRAIGRDRSDVIYEIGELTKEKGKDTEISAAIDVLSKTEERIANERARFLQELKSIVSIRQVGTYIVFERDFNQNLREIMQEIAKDRMGRRPLK